MEWLLIVYVNMYAGYNMQVFPNQAACEKIRDYFADERHEAKCVGYDSTHYRPGFEPPTHGKPIEEKE